MAGSKWFHVDVRTAEGQVVASTSDDAGTTYEDGTVRRALPGGLTMEATPRPDETRTALARALVHELRSPLNALGIYIDLLSRPAGPDDVGPSPDQLAERAQGQIRRLDELLQAYLTLAAPTDLDLAATLGALVRLGSHEAMRRGGSLTLVAQGPLPVGASAGPVVDALTVLLDAVWALPGCRDVTLRLQPAADRVRLDVEGARVPEAPLRAAFARVGATIASGEDGLVVHFPAAGALQ